MNKFQVLGSKFQEETGVSLYLSLIIISILLGIALGLSALLVAQIKLTRAMEESVIAFYAAETGIEKMLYDPVPNRSESLPNGSLYIAQIKCRPGLVGCAYGEDPSCNAPRYCIRSKGIFRSTQRAIEVKY